MADTSKKKVKPQRPPEDVASSKIAQMIADEADFDTAYEAVMERLRNVTRKKHGTLRYRQYVIGPVADELGIEKPDHSKVQGLLGRITRDASAIQILNRMHRDHMQSEAEAEKQKAVVAAANSAVTSQQATPTPGTGDTTPA
jgi:hypothetical protein